MVMGVAWLSCFRTDWDTRITRGDRSIYELLVALGWKRLEKRLCTSNLGSDLELPGSVHHIGLLGSKMWKCAQDLFGLKSNKIFEPQAYERSFEGIDLWPAQSSLRKRALVKFGVAFSCFCPDPFVVYFFFRTGWPNRLTIQYLRTGYMEWLWEDLNSSGATTW